MYDVLPKTLICEECGLSAKVRGYGRVEYDWPQTGRSVADVDVIMIRLTIDCPDCGIRTQDHHPAAISRSH